MQNLKKIAKIVLVVCACFLMTVLPAFAAESPAKKTFSVVSLESTSSTYTGKEKKLPKVTVKDADGKTVSSKYYTVSCKTLKNAGKYTVTVTGTGKYAGSEATAVYTIKKAKNTVKVTAKPKTVKASKVKTKKASAGTIKISSKAENATVTFTVANAKSEKNITVSSLGKVTVKKGAKKGTYKIKVSVSSKNYGHVTKTVTVKVK